MSEKGIEQPIGGGELAPYKEPEYRPLDAMLARVVMEFEKKPKTLEEEDLPEDLAYLESQDGKNLIMIRRRRPSEGYREPRTYHGYFTEAYSVNEQGEPIFGIEDMDFVAKGYRRIEVPDEPDHPFRPADLTPTQFGYTYGQIIADRTALSTKFLPHPGEAELGPIGQILANIKAKDEAEKYSSKDRREIREQITSRFFFEGKQGFTKEMGNAHLIITQNPNSDIVIASRELGLTPHTVSFDEMGERLKDTHYRIFSDFKDEVGVYPILVTVDDKPVEGEFQQNTRPGYDVPYQVRSRIIVRLEDELPFSVMFRKGEDKYPGVGRQDYGWYEIRGYEPDMAKKFMTKVGVDFALTSETRRIAGLLK